MICGHDKKHFVTLQASAALHGLTLHCIDGDFGRPVFIASRWAMTKQFDTLDEVNAWLRRVTRKDAEDAAL